MLLKGKKVVVVGGTSGIGLATAKLAVEHGAEVTIAGRDAAKCERHAADLGVHGVPVDVLDDQSVASLFAQCGEVDHVVTSAAQIRSGPFRTLSMEDARATVDSKVWGAWRVARAATIRAGGSLTFVSGFLSIRPRPNSAVVSLANGALEALGRSLALDLAPVRVNVVSPGIIDTPIRSRMGVSARQEVLDREAAHLPVGRVGQAEDVALQILAFMGNGFATGAVAYIDGGALIR